MSESSDQQAYFDWANLRANQYPALGYAFAIPNGEFRHRKTAGRLKAQGVKRGVPDVCLPVVRGDYAGLWIEFKFGRNRCTPEQLDFQQFLREQGYKVAVCYSTEDAIIVTEEYMGVPIHERTQHFSGEVRSHE